jgi:subfamily B ATP-binding cassette protein MsbA
MRDLLRLRFYAPHVALLISVAAVSILLNTALRSALVFQIRYVIQPALGEPPGKGASVDAGLPADGATPPGARAPGPLRQVKRLAESAKQRWYSLFGVEQAQTDAAERRRLLLASCVVLLFLGFGSSFAEMVSVYVTHYLAFSVLRGVRQRLFEHLQSLPLSFFENRHSGDLLSRISNDTTVLQAVFTSQIGVMLSGPPMAVAMLATMLWLNWRLSLSLFVLIPVVGGLSAWIGFRLRKQSRNVQARMADLLALSEETLGGIRVVQAFGMEPVVDGLFDRANRAVFRTSVRTARLRAINVPVASLLMVVGLAGALVIGGNEIIAGRMGGASDLISFMVAMVLLGTNVGKTTKLNLVIQQAAAPCSRIWEILDTESSLTDAPDAIELTEVKGRIAFRNVSFAYDAESGPVLRNVSLEIQPGEVVAIAGPSGAGKTTLANLVPRLYEVTSGSVVIDDTDVRKATRASLRGFMGIVPQDTVLFATTVGENIAYGRPEASREEIVAAAKAAQAHEFISALPGGYDMDIGEGGVKLSGGQRQRIAIARALLRDPRILILDEATSSLDAESESAVQAAINRLLQGRTALIIAHRLSTIRDADRIIVLDQGRIVEEGTHSELMAARGLYHALYETQLREETKAATTEAHEP